MDRYEDGCGSNKKVTLKSQKVNEWREGKRGSRDEASLPELCKHCSCAGIRAHMGGVSKDTG